MQENNKIYSKNMNKSMIEPSAVLPNLHRLRTGEKISFPIGREKYIKSAIYHVNNGGDKQFISRTYPSKNIINVIRVY